MQPFNDLTPEERDAQNEPVITFLKRVYTYSATEDRNRDVADYNETALDETQAIDHVRQRLRELAQGHQPPPQVINTDARRMHTVSMDQPINIAEAQSKKSWQQRARLIAIAAIVILLIGS